MENESNKSKSSSQVRPIVTGSKETQSMRLGSLNPSSQYLSEDTIELFDHP